MSDKGWIKLHRQIQDHWLWDDEPFTKAQAWIDLLLLANHENHTIRFNGVLIEVKQGQFITSIEKLAKRWLWSKCKVYRFIIALESEHMVKRESNNFRTVLTIVNYEFYQGKRNADESTHETRTSQPTERKRVNSQNADESSLETQTRSKELKNEKNVKNEKKNNIVAPLPLSDEDEEEEKEFEDDLSLEELKKMGYIV